ncbi:methionine--tRNA ligase mes1 [Coemansia sp. RSA 989]|nr:methionine--tRNA ligase mes1 [Coemansia sp. RSA 1086]KAJ1866950.1 methionine--tRNA ligase mes1 [Coemansia sp. RSA 989]KAJ2670842.1 methionine--tRNA ligase mes1 [Coemansia sp. RSA 1085]
MTNSVPLGITLVQNLGAPAANTAAAAGLLKVLIAAKATDTAVELTSTNKAASGSKLPFWVVLGDSQQTKLYDANAVVRFLYKTGSLAPADHIAVEQLFEWEEKTLSLFDSEKDMNAMLAAADSKAGQLSGGSTVGAVDAVVLGTMYFVLSNAKSSVLATFPSLQQWFSRQVASAAVTAALPIYTANIVKVLVREEPSLNNRCFNKDVEFNYDPSKKVLPIEGAKNILITSALPYVNNVPHLGNIIGSTLSADVFARYSRIRGNNTLFICGTDEYGTATETKALEEGVSCRELCDKYYAVHKEAYDWFGLSFDQFGRTSTDKQTEIVQGIFNKMHANGFISENTTSQLYCEKCSRFLADRFVEGTCPRCSYEDARGDQCDKCGNLLNATELIDPRCKLDGNSPIIRDSSHLFIDLDRLQPKCEEFIRRSSVEGKWSSNGLAITNDWLGRGLRPRAITRDLKWGVPVPLPGYESKVFYVWFDACIGYPSITAAYTPEWERWWKNPEQVKLYQFMGKDNVPFHTVVFPSSQIATGEDWTFLHHVSSCEYLNYESGKFSKSRNIGVFGNSARKTGVPADVWRYYLLSSRPETSDTDFTWDNFVSCNNAVLLANIGNLCSRVMKFLDKDTKYAGVIPAADPALIAPGADTADRHFIDDVNKLLAQYIEQMDGVHIKAALTTARDISARGNQYLQFSNMSNALFSDHRAQCDTVMALATNLVYLLSALFYPFMPATAASICRQLNAPLRLLPETFEIDLKPGHVTGRPEYLFTNIDEKKIAQWRAEFGSGTSA